VADWDDVRAAVEGLPDVTEADRRGCLVWAVHDKGFLWERPMRNADIAALGDAMRDAPILAARTADIGVKEALISDDPDVFFTTPHFEGYPAVLVWLDRIDAQTLKELAADAWLRQAPKRLAKAFLEARQQER
jgi:hypothetical protein